MVLRSTNMVCVLVWLGFYVWLYKPRTRATGGCMLYICRQQKMGVDGGFGFFGGGGYL